MYHHLHDSHLCDLHCGGGWCWLSHAVRRRKRGLSGGGGVSGAGGTEGGFAGGFPGGGRGFSGRSSGFVDRTWGVRLYCK